MNSFRIAALIILCATDYYSCCMPNTTGPKSSNSGLNINEDTEKKKQNARINKLVDAKAFIEGIDEKNLLGKKTLRGKVEKEINDFDQKIQKNIESIDENNLYAATNDDEYYKKLTEKNNEKNVYEVNAPDLNPNTASFMSSLKKCLVNLDPGGAVVNFIAEEPEDSTYDEVQLDISQLITFEKIKECFLKHISERRMVFTWTPNDRVVDAGGPSRQLLSNCYRNLLDVETVKLNQRADKDHNYLVFGDDMQYHDALLLGQLAFLSLTKDAVMEYNLPEVYYKIMLHDKNEKLEDYLTLADFKTMIGIRKETKDGNTVDGNLLIPVDIKINPKKDRVFLKYAKEEAYKIYLKLCQEDDNRKDFKAFEDNFEEEIAKLMFEGLGIKIKEVLGGFMDGFSEFFLRVEEISSYENYEFLEKYMKSYDPFFLFFQKNADINSLNNITNGIVNSEENAYVINGANGKVFMVTFDIGVIESIEKKRSDLKMANIIPICLPPSITDTDMEFADVKNLFLLMRKLEEGCFTRFNITRDSVIQAMRTVGKNIKKLEEDDGNILTEINKIGADNKKIEADNKKIKEDNKKIEADNKKIEEDNKKIEADNKKIEEDNENVGKNNKKLAENNKKLAENNKKIAENNKKIAENNKKIAENDKKIAENNKNVEKKLQMRDDKVLLDFRELLRLKNFRAQDLKYLFEGKEISSVEDFMGHFEIMCMGGGYDQAQFTKELVTDTIRKYIDNGTKEYSDQRSKDKYMNECLRSIVKYLTGSVRFNGTIKIIVNPELGNSIFSVNTCQKTVAVNPIAYKPPLLVIHNLVSCACGHMNNKKEFNFNEE